MVLVDRSASDLPDGLISRRRGYFRILRRKGTSLKRETNRLLVGWASEDITPNKPAELIGQYYPRVSRNVRDRIMATALALESSGAGKQREQAIMLSLDLAGIRRDLLADARAALRKELSDFDSSRLILNAIHTHCAPSPGIALNWLKSDSRCIRPEEYRAFLLERIVRAATAAWRSRRPGGASWALGHATVGHCRRAMYADGTAEMYGRTDRRDFVGMESSEDSGVDMLFFWDARKKPTGAIVNIPCPAQVMEATYCITADFIGDLRCELRKRFSKEFFVLAQIAPSGDQSPRDLARNYRGEPDMWNDAGAKEIGRRLADTVEDSFARASKTIQYRLPMFHRVRKLRLPLRRASRAEYREARRVFTELMADEPADPRSARAAFNRFVAQVRANERKGGPRPYDSKLHKFVLLRNNEAVIARYKTQDSEPTVPMELHTLRLGEVAFATNPFELYIDYGQRIKASSPAEQTFIVQLSSDYIGYLPTRRAVAGGGYGALIINGTVGPDGGDILVKKTLSALRRLWKE